MEHRGTCLGGNALKPLSSTRFLGGSAAAGALREQSLQAASRLFPFNILGPASEGTLWKRSLARDFWRVCGGGKSAASKV